MDYLPHIPGAPVAPSVELLFHIDGYLPGHSRERMVPNGRMHLVIELDGRPRHIYDNQSGAVQQVCRGAWLSGIQSNYITIGDMDSESRMLAVLFAPGGSVPFTHESAGEFRDAVVPAESVFGRGVLELRDTLLSIGSPAARLSAAEAWLAERFDEKLLAPDYVQSVLGELLQGPADVNLTEFVESRTSVSYRHFVDRFRYHVGPSPKSMQRILRFASIFERLQTQQAVNWAELSVELGFSDQAHFIREFRAFSGYRPNEFQSQQHDRANFFPDDPSD